jgi:hypothetical protein
VACLTERILPSLLLIHKRMYPGRAGGEVASTFDHPELVKLGYCDLIEEIIIGEDRVCVFLSVSLSLSFFHLPCVESTWGLPLMRGPGCR